jgi:hypothetical protein
VHQLGVTGNTGIYQIGAVTAIGGVYYGAAYPANDSYDTDYNLHMDIIRPKQ